jgi:hypothetical protein
MNITLKKVFQLSNYIYNLARITGLQNCRLNKIAPSVPFGELDKIHNLHVTKLTLQQAELERFIETYFPVLPPGWKDVRYKKVFEFFATYTLLKPGPDDVYLDAAGGIYSYIKKIECKKKTLQDIRVSQSIRDYLGDTVTFVESNADQISLPDGSVDRISVHHSIEHFQQEADTGFIREVQRLLSPRGKCCIIPIFLSEQFIEVVDTYNSTVQFAENSKKLVDITSILPGGKTSGNYARIYDINAFQSRIIDHIDHEAFKVTLCELELDGKHIPDMDLPVHKDVPNIECPHRVLMIERRQQADS